MNCVKASELIGLPVLSLKLKRLGQVQEVLFSQNGRRVCGLRLDGVGWPQSSRVLDYKGVLAVEETHVVARELYLAEDEPVRRCRDLTGLPVLTAGGAEAGLLDDLHLDAASGEVVALQLSKGLVDDLLVGKSLLPVEATLVAGEAAIMVETDENSSGGTH